jgi:pyrimidine-specific ribonucleoside hydrolase
MVPGTNFTNFGIVRMVVRETTGLWAAGLTANVVCSPRHPKAIAYRQMSNCRTLFLTLLAALFSLQLFPQTRQRPHVIVDTDAGTDDLMAIAYLLSSGEVDLKAVTVVNGLAHVEQGAKTILGLLELAGRRDVPVFIGEAQPLSGNAAFPDAWRTLSDDLPGLQLPRSERSPEKQSAVNYLANEIRVAAGGRKLRILATGPLTNLARAFEASGAGPRDIETIVIMGGAISVPGNLGDGGVFKTDNKSAEWNIYVDPLAANRVFAAGIPIELVPLDATNTVPIDPAFVQNFSSKASKPLGRFISQLLANEKELIEQRAFYTWDPLAAVVLTHPEVARFREYGIEIQLQPPFEGQTRRVPGGKPNARVAVSANAAAFMRIFTTAF